MGAYLMDAAKYIGAGLVFLAAYFVSLEVILRRKKRRITWVERGALMVLGVYLVIIFSVTVSPVYGFSGKINPDQINLIPGQVFRGASVNNLNLIGNFVMFLPLGFLLPVVSKRFRVLWKTMLGGAGLSILIEFSQLWNGRGTDIDDVILNTMGSVVGYAIALLALEHFEVLRTTTGISKRIGKECEKRDQGVVFALVAVMYLSVIGSGFWQRYELLTEDDSANIMAENEGSREENGQASSETQGSDTKATESEETASVSANAITNSLSGIDSASLEATNVCVASVKDGGELFGKNETAQIAPASTTKMLTALTVVEYCELDEEVTVGEELSFVAADASVAGLWQGAETDVETLLEGLLLPSGNDAAYALAAYTGRKIAGDNSLSCEDAVERFVEQMNEKAQKIGATNSHFVRPDGYDESGQYTTAADLAVIAREFLSSREQDGILGQIVAMPRARACFADGTDFTWENSNQLLQQDGMFYDPEAIGLKTGSSSAAGKCLVSAVNFNDSIYIVVVMGDQTDEGRYIDTLSIYNQIRQSNMDETR